MMFTGHALASTAQRISWEDVLRTSLGLSPMKYTWVPLLGSALSMVCEESEFAIDLERYAQLLYRQEIVELAGVSENF